MGTIRGMHVSPGVYTKYTSVQTPKTITINKTAPKSTLYVNPGGGINTNGDFYFGWINIKTKDGEMTAQAAKELSEMTESKIKAMSTIKPQEKKEDGKLPLNGTISEKISQQELVKQIESGKSYAEIADKYNNCITIIIPKDKYESSQYDVIKKIFGGMEVSVKDQFVKIKDITINGAKSVMLCMFNRDFAFAPVGNEKKINELILKY